MENTDTELLQWHPAFFADIQIELREEAEYLIFENEHQLGTKPMEIDVLIIKKETVRPVKKNIGRIFRKYNIIEYKSPRDYLSIDDFYKVYGYTCFYKADTKKVDSISVSEMTITLIGKRYPERLAEHLQKERGYQVVRTGMGIYQVTGDQIPIQIIVTRELSTEENLWLSSLTDELRDAETVDRLLNEYKNNRNNTLYKSTMNMIVRANEIRFREAKKEMCEALEELMADVIEERVAEQVEQRVAEQVEQRVAEQVEQRVAEQIEQRMAAEKQRNLLHVELAKAGRAEDILRASENPEYEQKLFAEFQL